MKPISEMSAIELQVAIDKVDYPAGIEKELAAAYREIQRLRGVCQDIIEYINTDYDIIYGDGISEQKVLDIAHKYFEG